MSSIGASHDRRAKRATKARRDARSIKLRDVITSSLTPLAVAREYEASHPTIPAPRPVSDCCVSCGGTLRDWPAWMPSGVRCPAHFAAVAS